MEAFVNNMEVYIESSMLLSFISAFVGGVLTSFTPCVYPMIPITASFVCAGNIGGSKLRGFVLSLAYVFGMAVVYSSLGIFAALTGRFFGEVSTNPYAYFIVANIIIACGLAMLDVIPIPVLGGRAGATQGRGVAGAFLIGMASGFVAAPCTAPVLGVLLAYVATTQNVPFGGALLFFFSLGLGTLLVLVGTFSGILATLPRSGEWMLRLKKVMGFFMIALGEYFLIKMGELIV